MDFKNIVNIAMFSVVSFCQMRAMKSFTYSTGQMLVFSGLHLTSKNANTAKIRDCTENDFCDIQSIVYCCEYFNHSFYSQVTSDCDINEESEKDNLQDNLEPVMNDINITKKAPNKLTEE